MGQHHHSRDNYFAAAKAVALIHTAPSADADEVQYVSSTAVVVDDDGVLVVENSAVVMDDIVCRVVMALPDGDGCGDQAIAVAIIIANDNMDIR